MDGIPRPVGARGDEGLAGKVRQTAQRRVGHRLGCLSREAAPKDGERLERGAFLRAEQRPGVVKHGPDAAVPPGKVAHLRLEEVEILGDLGGDFVHGQHVDPRSRQENGERHSAGQAKDLG